MSEHIRATKHVTNSQGSLYEMRISQVRKEFSDDPVYQTHPRCTEQEQVMESEALVQICNVVSSLQAMASQRLVPNRLIQLACVFFF
jgi:hypothetical protein